MTKQRKKPFAREVSKALRNAGDPAIAEHSQRFFKTGKGEYGEGDKFLGIRVPVIRKLVKKFSDVSFEDVATLLKSLYHEQRLFALLWFVAKYAKANTEERKAIYEFYMQNTTYINNWDLVDSSASHIVGAYLENMDKQPIYDLSKSDDLWERRISIISTFHMIKKNEFDVALDISRILLYDKEDLIHKAVGWMLREIGKRDPVVVRDFLNKHYKEMPRTMLRYAIEKFPEKERKKYLKGIV